MFPKSSARLRTAVAFAAGISCLVPVVSRGEIFFLQDGQLSSFNGAQSKLVVADARAEPPRLLHLHDWKKISQSHQFLVSKKRDDRYVPNSDAPTGFDLWLQKDSGEERSLHSSAWRAKFSPASSRIAYTTTDCELFIEDIAGKKLLKIERAYNPSWKRDGAKSCLKKFPKAAIRIIPKRCNSRGSMSLPAKWIC